MRIAVGTTGDTLDARVGSEVGWCPHFVIVDTESMGYSVVSQPTLESYEEASLAAIQTLAQQDVSAVLIAGARPRCRRLMNQLGIDVVEGVQELTVRQAVERFVSGALSTFEEQREPARIAVASDGDNLDAPVGSSFGACTRFMLVDPDSLEYDVVSVEPKAFPQDLSVEGIRTAARGGAQVVIAPRVQPRCLGVLIQLGMDVVLCEPGLSVRQAVDLYERGELISTP